MDFISFILMQLLFAFTILVEPFLRTNFYRFLKKQLNIEPTARLLFYRTQVLWEREEGKVNISSNHKFGAVWYT